MELVRHRVGPLAQRSIVRLPPTLQPISFALVGTSGAFQNWCSFVCAFFNEAKGFVMDHGIDLVTALVSYNLGRFGLRSEKPTQYHHASKNAYTKSGLVFD
eukprot:scaffold56629_cov45-Prasinocladus_malaysianus.AAC.3